MIRIGTLLPYVCSCTGCDRCKTGVVHFKKGDSQRKKLGCGYGILTVALADGMPPLTVSPDSLRSPCCRAELNSTLGAHGRRIDFGQSGIGISLLWVRPAIRVMDSWIDYIHNVAKSAETNPDLHLNRMCTIEHVKHVLDCGLMAICPTLEQITQYATADSKVNSIANLPLDQARGVIACYYGVSMADFPNVEY